MTRFAKSAALLRDLGYFYSVAAGCFLSLWVKVISLKVYFDEATTNKRKTGVENSFGLVLISNWDGLFITDLANHIFESTFYSISVTLFFFNVIST